MKKTLAILTLLLIMIGNDASAQFRKSLQSATNRNGYSEAKYNIGIVGGVTSTYWAHFGGTKTKYQSPIVNFGITGGVSVERILNKDMSVAIEGYYAIRNMELSYEVLNFPVSLGTGPEHNWDFYRQLNANYQEVNVQVPFTYYFGQANSSLRPYVFAAPRFSLPLSGIILWQKTRILGYGTEDQHLDENDWTLDTVAMNAQNSRQWNIGLVLGVGLRYKINIGNYYLIAKADISGHAAAINSFSQDEIHGEVENVIGAGYIDPYLLGMRFNTDATVKVTLMFPLKKQLKGACMRWGEYD